MLLFALRNPVDLACITRFYINSMLEYLVLRQPSFPNQCQLCANKNKNSFETDMKSTMKLNDFDKIHCTCIKAHIGTIGVENDEQQTQRESATFLAHISFWN